MNQQAKLFWIDLEMTVLDPKRDRILEVAAIATDWAFNEIARFEAIIRVDDELMQKQMVGDFWNKFSHVRDALQKQNNKGETAEQIESQLIEFLRNNFDDDRVILAGNSIHQDRKFIDNEWPNLSKMLHYRMLDVSAWKLVFENKFGKRFLKPESHRAIDDIVGSIDEMKRYLSYINAS